MPRSAGRVDGRNVDRRQQLRELLLDTGPMSTEAIFQAVKHTTPASFTRASVGLTLTAMPDVYVTSWVPSRDHMKYVPVWAAVKVPEDAPYPSKPPPDRKTYRRIIRC